MPFVFRHAVSVDAESGSDVCMPEEFFLGIRPVNPFSPIKIQDWFFPTNEWERCGKHRRNPASIRRTSEAVAGGSILALMTERSKLPK